ncbi:hypothetical protein BSKO_06131 [Bryopsis sp. KO-2023]|nr:hypothetical protein BSKO_06131 [Bryopsis sp. KO-2023]
MRNPLLGVRTGPRRVGAAAMVIALLLGVELVGMVSSNSVCESARDSVAPAGVGVENDRIDIRADSILFSDGEVARSASCRGAGGRGGAGGGACSGGESLVMEEVPRRVLAMLTLGQTFTNVSRLQRDAYNLVKGKDCLEAEGLLLKSVAMLLFPHKDPAFLSRWHRGLALPGALHRKPRLSISGALMLAADCQFQTGKEEYRIEGLHDAYQLLMKAGSLLASDLAQNNYHALALLERIHHSSERVILAINEMLSQLKKFDSTDHQDVKSINHDLEQLGKLISAISESSNAHQACSFKPKGKNVVEECVEPSMVGIVNLLPPHIFRELDIPWSKAEPSGEEIDACENQGSIPMMEGCYERDGAGFLNSTIAKACMRGSPDCLFNVYRRLKGSREEDRARIKYSNADEAVVPEAQERREDEPNIHVGEIIKTKVCEETLDGCLGFIGANGWEGVQGDIVEKFPKHVSGVQGVRLGNVAADNEDMDGGALGSEPWALPFVLEGGTVLRKDSDGVCGHTACLGIDDLVVSIADYEENDLEGFVDKITTRYYTDIAGYAGEDADGLELDFKLGNAVDRMHFVNRDSTSRRTCVDRSSQNEAGVVRGSSTPGDLPDLSSLQRDLRGGGGSSSMRQADGGMLLFGRVRVSLDASIWTVIVAFVSLFIGMTFYVLEPWREWKLVDFVQSWVSKWTWDAHQDQGSYSENESALSTAKRKKVDGGSEVQRVDDTIGAIIPGADSLPSNVNRGGKSKKGKSKANRNTVAKRGREIDKKPLAPAGGQNADAFIVKDNEKGWVMGGKCQKGGGWQEVGPGGKPSKRSDKKHQVAPAKTVQSPAPLRSTSLPSVASIPGTPKKSSKSQPRDSPPSHGAERRRGSVKLSPPGLGPSSPVDPVDKRKQEGGGFHKRWDSCDSKAHIALLNSASRQPPPDMWVASPERMQPLSSLESSSQLTAQDPAVPAPLGGAPNVAGVIGQLINHRNQYLDGGPPPAFSPFANHAVPNSLLHTHSELVNLREDVFGYSSSQGGLPTPYPGVSMPAGMHHRAASVPGLNMRLDGQDSGGLMGLESTGERRLGSSGLSGQYSLFSTGGRSIWSMDPSPSIWSSDPLASGGGSQGDVVGLTEINHRSKPVESTEDLKDRLPEFLLSDQCM